MPQGTRTYSALINRAFEVSAIAHEGQYRKNPSESIPYVSHACMVGFILERAGAAEEVVAAGILHDVLEDTDYPQQALVDEFGSEIIEWILWVTERDKSLTWERRKADYLHQLQRAPSESLTIAVADKIHNLHSALNAVQRGEDIWSRFTRDPETTLDNWKQILAVVQQRLKSPLVGEFEELLREVECVRADGYVPGAGRRPERP